MNSKDSERKPHKPLKPPKTYIIYDFMKVTGCIPALLIIRPKIHYLSERSPKKIKGAMLVSCNHTTFIDPMILLVVFWRRRLLAVATKDLFDTWLKDFAFNQMHCIKVDKENFTLEAYKNICGALNTGHLVSIYPEGEIHNSNEGLLNFKTGVVHMARRGNAPILPVFIVPKDKWYQRQHVVIGEPIDVREMLGERPSKEQIREVCDYVRQRELELQQHYYENCAKNKKG